MSNLGTCKVHCKIYFSFCFMECMHDVIFHTLYTCSKRYIYSLYIAFFIELYIQFLFWFDCRSYIVHSFFYFTFLNIINMVFVDSIFAFTFHENQGWIQSEALVGGVGLVEIVTFLGSR